jgi:predicted PurR-regulated permease PerM
MKVRIEIDTKTFVRFWLVVIGFGIGIIALYSARTALVILGTAFFLALALNGPVSRLSRHLPDRSRTLSTALAFSAVVLFLGAVIFLVIPPVVQQTVKFLDNAPTLVQTVSDQWHGVGDLVNKYHIQPQVDQAVSAIRDNAGHWASGFGRNFLSGLGSAMSLFAASLLVLVLTFLMLIEGPTWMDRIWSVYKNDRRVRTHKRLVHRMQAVVSGYVSGQLSVSGIDAVAAGVTVFILSRFFSEVPANLALPTVAICFTFSLIPLFGATIAGIIVTLLLAINSLPAAAIFAVYFVIYQQLENNVISPRIQSKRIELSPLAVLTAVTIGLYVFGIAGGIISIPIAGCVKVLVEDYFEDRGEDLDEPVEDEPKRKKLSLKFFGKSGD